MSDYMKEMERLVSDLIDAAHGTVMTEDQEREDTARAALLAHAAQADRDAPVELPEPDGWLCWTCETNHVAFCKYEPKAYPRREQAVRMSRVMQYGDAREAAGYARGRAEQQAVIDRLMMEHCPDEMTTKQRQTWAAAQAQEGGECMVPPLGWRCTRGAGHDGPCAAVAYPDDVEIVERAMQRLRETPISDAQKGDEL